MNHLTKTFSSNLFTKMALLVMLQLAIYEGLNAQTQVVTTPRTSPRASVSQTVGITEVSIEYSRPGVRGRDIWGAVVPFGMSDPGWGTAKIAPWRIGADENTVISFSTPVKINGKQVPAGRYGMFMTIEPTGKVEIILCSNSSSWGAYFYDEAEVIARVQSSWEENGFTEYLEFSFTDFTQNSVYCALRWENKAIPFEISVDLNQTVVAQLREDMRGTARFSHVGPMEAAAWCVEHETNLEEALEWAQIAANMSEQFATLKVLADAQRLLGKSTEAEATMKRAFPLASVFELHAYGKQLITLGEKKHALEVFETNAKLHPDTWPVNYGLARGYSALGNYKEALVYLKKAEKESPDDWNTNLIKENIIKLESGNDIN